MKMSGTKLKRYRQVELFDTHAPLQPPPGWYAPLLVANFSPSSLICALPDVILLVTDTSLWSRIADFATFHEFLALSTFSLTNHLHASNLESMSRSNFLLISYIIRGRRAFSSPRWNSAVRRSVTNNKRTSFRAHCWVLGYNFVAKIITRLQFRFL